MTQSQFQPPPTTNCAFCGRPLGTNYHRVNGRPACDQCVGRISQIVQLNEFSPGAWTVGLVYGIAAAILCGFGWAVIVKVTHLEIGIVAAFIGYIVTRAILAGANGRRGRSVQIIAVLCSLLGIIVGKGLIITWVLWAQVKREIGVHDDSLLVRAVWFILAPIVSFRIFDLVWYAFAAYQAWRMSGAIRLRIDPPQQARPPMVNGEIVLEDYQRSQSAESQAAPQPEQPPGSPPPRSTPLPQAILITLVSAAISVFVYAREEGWQFAIGSVLSILVHEMGHTVACLLYGLPASSPIFIPYVGAVINLRAQPPDAKVESVIGIAGPWGGLLATVACFIWFKITHSDLAAMLVQFGAMINLFNLLPIHPLDGGRIARGVAPAFWVGFLGLMGAFCWLAPQINVRREVAILLGVITLFGIGRTLQGRKGEYYRISETAAWSMGFAYLGTAAALLWMWWEVRAVGSIF